MDSKDTILTINVVEPALVQAVKKHSQTLGRELKGLVLVNKEYADYEFRPKDNTGLFEEIVCDFNNPDELQSVLMPYTDRLLAATCRYEEALQPFAKVIPFIPYLFTPSESSLLWSTEKPLMRDRLKNYDPNLVPKYHYMSTQDLPELSTIVKDFKFPVIVKPSGLAKALLVNECQTEDELRAQLEHTFKVIDQAYSREHYPGNPGILVEEMMEGDMYSTDAYVTHDGQVFCLPLIKVITAQSLGLPGFYSYRHIIPTSLAQEEINAAFAASESAIRALNLASTSTHIELFHTSQGWKIIEVAARIGGYRQDLYREVYGIEHYYNDLLIHMGKKPQMPKDVLRHAAGFNMYADKEGEILSIEGVEEARKLDSVVYIADHAKKGDIALFAGNGGDLIVDGILSNANPDQLEEDMVKIRQLLKIEVKTQVTMQKKLLNSRGRTDRILVK